MSNEKTRNKLKTLFGINENGIPIFVENSDDIIDGYLNNIKQFVKDNDESSIVISANENTYKSFIKLLEVLFKNEKLGDIKIKLNELHDDGDKDVLFFNKYVDTVLYATILTENGVNVYPIFTFNDNSVDFNEEDIEYIINYIFGGK